MSQAAGELRSYKLLLTYDGSEEVVSPREALSRWLIVASYFELLVRYGGQAPPAHIGLRFTTHVETNDRPEMEGHGWLREKRQPCTTYFTRAKLLVPEVNNEAQTRFCVPE